MSTFILDDTKIYETEDASKRYLPENYIPKNYGPITLGEALGNSLNTSSVRITEILGLGRVYDQLRAIGISLEKDIGYYGYGLILG
jgi:penicillin-binding protein 1C